MINISDIKKYMKDKRISQVELAEKSQIPLGTLNAIFSGRRKTPRLDTMNAICNALGLQYDVPLQPTIIDENNLAHFRTSRKNMIVVYDNSGDEYRFEFKKDNLEKILKICENVADL